MLNEKDTMKIDRMVVGLAKRDARSINGEGMTMEHYITWMTAGRGWRWFDPDGGLDESDARRYLKERWDVYPYEFEY